MARAAMALALCLVIAAEEVIACALSDQLWRELYSQETTFRDWCDQQLWPQELLALLEVLEKGTAVTESSALDQLEQALAEMEAVSTLSQ